MDLFTDSVGRSRANAEEACAEMQKFCPFQPLDVALQPFAFDGNADLKRCQTTNLMTQVNLNPNLGSLCFPWFDVGRHATPIASLTSHFFFTIAQSNICDLT